MRIKWIDTAKGIAMLCVILGHMGGIMIGDLNLNFVFAFHLPVFFLLSGYTLKKKDLTKEYISDKFKRFMIPYFITCFCVLIMDIFNQCFLLDDANIYKVTDVIATDLIRFFFASGTKEIFGYYDMGTRIGAIWFLPAMFFAIVIVQYVLNRVETHYMRWIIVISIALLAYASSEFIWFPFSIQSGVFATVFILAGYYIREYDVLSKLNWKYYALFAIILVYAINSNNTGIYYVTNYFPDIVISLIVSFTSAFLILKLSMYLENSRYLSFVGNNSIYFLGVHLFALETLGEHFEELLSLIDVSKDFHKVAMLICHVLFSTLATWCILFVRDKIGKKRRTKIQIIKERDYTIDVAKGILIVTMLIGSYSIDSTFRGIIYSFHMMAFVFFSGYFYKKKENPIKVILYTAKRFLIPYAVFCVCDFILSDVPSIGPIYFILLLFCVKMIYIVIDSCVKKEVNKIMLVVLISYLGMQLGINGFWLPWSFDCALYAVVFYMIGHYCKKYEVLKFIKENLILYFVFATMWAYMIFKGSMEVSIRAYNQYGLVIVGAISGTLLLYLLCSYIYDEFPRWITSVFLYLGKNILYILIVHTLIGSDISRFVGQVFDPKYFFHMVINIFLQLLIGILVGELFSFVKRNVKDRNKGLL